MAGRRRKGVRLQELRVLEGPNLYFTRPAIKLTVAIAPWHDLSEAGLLKKALKLEFSGGAPGGPNSEQRRHYLARLAAHLARSLAEAEGSRLAVRGRVGAQPEEVIVAYPWRRLNAAEAFAREIVRLFEVLLVDRRAFKTILRERARRLELREPGQEVTIQVPTIPVIHVSGTNGKTTTVRLIAHIARCAGLSVAYTTTDGVYFNEELKIIGDYSGFGGAAAALAMPAVQIAVLEVARGGILLRGIGTAHNDAAVLTNVSEDHLDQHGIRTLDQLAEVKATITRITKPDGWDILNADDPRVLGTRRIARGRIWLYSMDHDHPAIRHVLAERGRSMTVVDGCLVAAYSRHEASKLMPLEDIPVTLAGISSQHIHNAMAAAAAALSVGLPETAVVEGLRSFVLDQRQNPGRANLFEVDGKVVVVDYAHNEEGMKGLVEIARGLCRPDSSTWLTFCSAGDRTNAILHRLAYTAARGFDKVMVAELERYLRGRDPKELVDRLKAGVVDGGKPEPVVMKDEMTALKSMLAEAGPGDVVAITALSQRPEVFAYLSARSAKELGPERVRELVRQARG